MDATILFLGIFVFVVARLPCNCPCDVDVVPSLGDRSPPLKGSLIFAAREMMVNESIKLNAIIVSLVCHTNCLHSLLSPVHADSKINSSLGNLASYPSESEPCSPSGAQI